MSATTYASASTAGRHRSNIDDRSWFRGDVEGLRAVAILLVVLYHIGVPGLTGGYVGVDVFFVISGFLITSVLLRELNRTGRISIAGFYARRFIRLLPAAALVITVTLVASWLWLPATRFRAIAVDALYTTAYGLNFHLADRGTDYLASAEPPSPLQHFWSLAVEEQFYFVWPILLSVASLAWYARGRWVNRASIAVVLVMLIAGSLTVSVWQTNVSVPWAFFGPHTRAWELALGALVAVFAAECARLPRLVAKLAGMVGMTAVITSAFVFTTATPFPGYVALLPVGGTALVIAAGSAAPLNLLQYPTMQALGGVSYSWYLWHWPVLLIGPHLLDSPLNLMQRAIFALFALGLAAATLVAVENPIRYRPSFKAAPWKGIGLGLALSVTVAVLALAATVVPLRAVATGDAVAGFDVVAGSAPEQQLARLIATSAGRASVPANLTPPLLDAGALPPVYANGCHRPIPADDVKTPCVFGDRAGKTTMVLTGDSHAAHWFNALDQIAKQRHMRLVVVTKSACSAAAALTVHSQLKREYTECQRWREQAWEHIASLKPALVVMSSNGSGGTIINADDQDRAWAAAWATSIRAVTPSGAKVVVISDTPWPAMNTPECVAANSTDLKACVRGPKQALLKLPRRAMIEQAARAAGATVIDPVAWFCTPTACPVVIGNMLVYRDESHMTTVYSAALAPVLASRLP